MTKMLTLFILVESTSHSVQYQQTRMKKKAYKNDPLIVSIVRVALHKLVNNHILYKQIN